MPRRVASALLVAAMTAVIAGCGGVNDPSKNQIETFNGTIPKGQAAQPHTFNISKTGEISITVTSLTPAVPVGTYFGVAFGPSSSDQCGATPATLYAVVGASAVNGPIYNRGTYCAYVFDVGLFTVDEAYTLKVSHP